MSPFSKLHRNTDSGHYASKAGNTADRQTTKHYEPPDERIQFTVKSHQGTAARGQSTAKAGQGNILNRTGVCS